MLQIRQESSNKKKHTFLAKSKIIVYIFLNLQITIYRHCLYIVLIYNKISFYLSL